MRTTRPTWRSRAASSCPTRHGTPVRFDTRSGRAEFAVSTVEALQIPPGHLVLQTLRSHDQYNTTIYGLSDRYRGIEGGRRVVLVNPADIEHLGFDDGDLVDLVTHWPGDGTSAARRRSGSSATRPLGLGGGVLPGDQPARAARLDRSGQQHTDLEVGDHPDGPRRLTTDDGRLPGASGGR